MAGSPVFSINFTNRLIPAKPKYLMSIENSQAILKYFIDLKSSVWFTLGSEEETMFCDTEIFSDRLPVKVFKILNSRQSGIFNKLPIDIFQRNQTIVCRDPDPSSRFCGISYFVFVSLGCSLQIFFRAWRDK